jgi:pyruvate kinase
MRPRPVHPPEDPPVRRAKIVATLGPALDDPDRLRAAIAAGIDVVRLNFSHGSREEHQRRLELSREIGASLGRNVGSLGDLQGPKIRLGMVPEAGVELKDGGEVVLVAGEEDLDRYDDGAGTPVLPVVYEQLADDVDPGALILLDDGLLRLVVSRVEGNRVTARVVAGGPAKSRKGVNLPGVEVSAKSLTDKDLEDVRTMVDLGVDWIALSFVRRPEDVTEVRDIVQDLGGQQPIIAKLERPEAIDDLEAIIAATDAVMVARGDLGVEVGPERVPAIQKEIIDLANSAGRPVITATEMLDSMIRSPRPTRAEASDVANAIFDGTDAVMLSGETAAGRFPVEAVRTMARIIEVAESSAERVHPVPPGDRPAPAPGGLQGGGADRRRRRRARHPGLLHLRCLGAAGVEVPPPPPGDRADAGRAAAAPLRADVGDRRRDRPDQGPLHRPHPRRRGGVLRARVRRPRGRDRHRLGDPRGPRGDQPRDGPPSR